MKFKFTEEYNFLTNKFCKKLNKDEVVFIKTLEKFLSDEVIARLSKLDSVIKDNKNNKFNYNITLHINQDHANIELIFLEDPLDDSSENNLFDVLIYKIPKKYQKTMISYNVQPMLDNLETILQETFSEYVLYTSKENNIYSGASVGKIKITQTGFKSNECTNN